MRNLLQASVRRRQTEVADGFLRLRAGLRGVMMSLQLVLNRRPGTLQRVGCGLHGGSGR